MRDCIDAELLMDFPYPIISVYVLSICVSRAYNSLVSFLHSSIFFIYCTASSTDDEPGMISKSAFDANDIL